MRYTNLRDETNLWTNEYPSDRSYDGWITIGRDKRRARNERWDWCVTAYWGLDHSCGLPHERELACGFAKTRRQAEAQAETVLYEAIANERRYEAELDRIISESEED